MDVIVRGNDVKSIRRRDAETTFAWKHNINVSMDWSQPKVLTVTTVDLFSETVNWLKTVKMHLKVCQC